MLHESRCDDIVTSGAFSGLPANWLRASLAAAGLGPDALDSAALLPVFAAALAISCGRAHLQRCRIGRATSRSSTSGWGRAWMDRWRCVRSMH